MFNPTASHIWDALHTVPTELVWGEAGVVGRENEGNPTRGRDAKV